MGFILPNLFTPIKSINDLYLRQRMESSEEIVCQISGGIDQVKILHRFRVVKEDSTDSQRLSSLCERLTELKEVVNASLTELVEKQKGLPSANAGKDQMKDNELEEEGSSDSGS